MSKENETKESINDVLIDKINESINKIDSIIDNLLNLAERQSSNNLLEYKLHTGKTKTKTRVKYISLKEISDQIDFYLSLREIYLAKTRL